MTLDWLRTILLEGGTALYVVTNSTPPKSKTGKDSDYASTLFLVLSLFPYLLSSLFLKNFVFNIYVDSPSSAHEHTHTLSLPHSYSLSLSHTHTHSLSLSLTHTHTHSLSLSLSHTHTHTLTLSISLSHTHIRLLEEVERLSTVFLLQDLRCSVTHMVSTRLCASKSGKISWWIRLLDCYTVIFVVMFLVCYDFITVVVVVVVVVVVIIIYYCYCHFHHHYY